MSELHPTASEFVTATCAGPEAYAIGIQGDAMAPTLCNGQRAIFDPATAGAGGLRLVTAA